MGDRVESRCLQGLPNELLLKIFSHVPYNFLRASVTRVCQHFKVLIDKIEMKSLELKVTFPEQEIFKRKPNGRNMHPMSKLLRMFMVQQFKEVSWLPPSYDRFRRFFGHLAKHPKRLKEIRSISVTVEDISWYLWYFQQKGLLDSLPYLEHLTLSPPPLFSRRFPTPISNNGRRALRSLRLDFSYLTSQGYRGDAYYGIRNVISHHLYWLELHKLRIDGLDWVDGHLLRDEKTSIRDLWCVGSRNCEAVGTAVELMRSSTGLVRFIFETNDSYVPTCAFPRPFPPPLSPFSLYESGLSWHKCTLRQLVFASSGVGIIPKVWTLGPLDTFCQIKKLAAPFFMLPKPILHKSCYELLPPNLEDLQIEYPFDWEAIVIDNRSDLKEIRSSVRKMRSSLPYLKRLIMWHQKDQVQMADTNGAFPDQTPLEKFRMHEQVCEELGVKFE